MRARSYCTLSAIVFALVALAHAVRLYQHWPVQLGPLLPQPHPGSGCWSPSR